jgi:hypothetical protein
MTIRKKALPWRRKPTLQERAQPPPGLRSSHCTSRYFH